MSGDAATSLPLMLEWLPGRYAVCRLDPDQPIPSWARLNDAAARLLSITRTDRELSIVIDQSLIPPGPAAHATFKVERDFVAFRTVGDLGFSLVGILATLTNALTAAKVPVFVISTFETDVMLVLARHRKRAETALQTVARLTTAQQQHGH